MTLASPDPGSVLGNKSAKPPSLEGWFSYEFKEAEPFPGTEQQLSKNFND